MQCLRGRTGRALGGAVLVLEGDWQLGPRIIVESLV